MINQCPACKFKSLKSFNISSTFLIFINLRYNSNSSINDLSFRLSVESAVALVAIFLSNRSEFLTLDNSSIEPVI